MPGWSKQKSGYVTYTSRKKDSMPRNTYQHRAVMEVVLGDVISGDMVVHHMDGNKANNCPRNLVLMPKVLNDLVDLRCPHTGRWITKEEYRRRVGKG